MPESDKHLEPVEAYPPYREEQKYVKQNNLPQSNNPVSGQKTKYVTEYSKPQTFIEKNPSGGKRKSRRVRKNKSKRKSRKGKARKNRRKTNRRR